MEAVNGALRGALGATLDLVVVVLRPCELLSAHEVHAARAADRRLMVWFVGSLPSLRMSSPMQSPSVRASGKVTWPPVLAMLSEEQSILVWAITSKVASTVASPLKVTSILHRAPRRPLAGAERVDKSALKTSGRRAPALPMAVICKEEIATGAPPGASRGWLVAWRVTRPAPGASRGRRLLPRRRKGCRRSSRRPSAPEPPASSARPARTS